MPWLHCPDCKLPLAHFSSPQDIAREAEGQVKQVFAEHRLSCSGRELEMLRAQRLFSASQEV